MPIEQIFSSIQHYATGEKPGISRTPLIPQLQEAAGQNAGAPPWAELWIGAYPGFSSRLARTGEELSALIAAHPDEMLGKGNGYGPNKNQLSYLLKIICCCEPLSLQMHPDPESAKKLHAMNPKDFPDDNPKPEILIALSRYSMLAGFRPLVEIQQDLSRISALMPWQFRGAGYKELCSGLYDLPDTQLEKMLEDTLKETAGSLLPQDMLFRRLCQKYPGDATCLFAYLLNLVVLQPGEGVFIPANTPHTYLDGQGIECMSNSNNVIRAGLTKKPVYPQLLLEHLDYRPLSLDELKFTGKHPLSPNCLADFRCPDFRLRLFQGMKTSSETDITIDEAATLYLLDGEALFTDKQGTQAKATKGTGWFLDAQSAPLSCQLSAGCRLICVTR